MKDALRQPTLQRCAHLHLKRLAPLQRTRQSISRLPHQAHRQRSCGSDHIDAFSTSMQKKNCLPCRLMCEGGAARRVVNLRMRTRSSFGRQLILRQQSTAMHRFHQEFPQQQHTSSLPRHRACHLHQRAIRVFEAASSFRVSFAALDLTVALYQTTTALHRR
jgi:hypothetical protein